MILISIVSATNGTVLTLPRAFFAMARDGVFFRGLAEVHPRFGTPAVAIVTCSIWSMVLAVSGTFEQLFTYVMFVGWIFYALGALSIFRYRRKEPTRPGRSGCPAIRSRRSSSSPPPPPSCSTPSSRSQAGRRSASVCSSSGRRSYLVWRRRGAPAGAEPASPVRRSPRHHGEDGIVIRRVETQAEYEECVRIQD